MSMVKTKVFSHLLSTGATLFAVGITTTAHAGTYCEWGWYAPDFSHHGASCTDADTGHGITYFMGVNSGVGPSQENTESVVSGTGWWLRTDVDCNNSGEYDGTWVQGTYQYSGVANWCVAGDDMIMGEGYVYVY